MELLRYRCIVLPGSKFRRFWDLTSLVLLMYVAIFTPVQIAFFGDAMSIPRWREWLMIFLLDRVVDIVFTIDIFINFRTAWKDAAGEDDDPESRQRTWVGSRSILSHLSFRLYNGQGC